MWDSERKDIGSRDGGKWVGLDVDGFRGGGEKVRVGGRFVE